MRLYQATMNTSEESNQRQTGYSLRNQFATTQPQLFSRGIDLVNSHNLFPYSSNLKPPLGKNSNGWQSSSQWNWNGPPLSDSLCSVRVKKEAPQRQVRIKQEPLASRLSRDAWTNQGIFQPAPIDTSFGDIGEKNFPISTSSQNSTNSFMKLFENSPLNKRNTGDSVGSFF